MEEFKGLAIKHHIYNTDDIKKTLKIEVENQHQSLVLDKIDSETSESNDIYVRNFSKGCVIFSGKDFIHTETELQVLSANNQVLNFSYNQNTKEIQFQVFENEKNIKKVLVINGEVKLNEGNTLDVEYSGIKGEDLFQYLFFEITGEKFNLKYDEEFLCFKYLKKSNETLEEFSPTPSKNETNIFRTLKKPVISIPKSRNRIPNSILLYSSILIAIFLLSGLIFSFLPKDISKSESDNISTNLFRVDREYCKMYGLPEIDFSCSYSPKLAKYLPEKGEENGKYIAFNIETNGICSEAIALNFLAFDNYGFKSELFLTKVLESTVAQMEKFDSFKFYESSFGKIKIADKEYLVWRGKGKPINSKDGYKGDYLLQHIIFLNGKEKNALFITMCANQDSKIKSFEDFNTKGYISEVLQTLKFEN